MRYEKKVTFKNDFENQALSYGYTISDSLHRSGMYSARILPDKEYTPCYSVEIKDLGEKLPHFIFVDFWAFNPGQGKVDANVVCAMDKNDSTVVWQSRPFPPIINLNAAWQKIHSRFVIPDGVSRELRINIYIWNPKKSYFFADDLTVVFE